MPADVDDALTRDMIFLDGEFVTVIERHFLIRLGHDRESIARLDRLFAGSALRQIARDDMRNVAVMCAAYLGETIRALAGGRWKQDEALGPCVVDVPHVKGAIRVLARAEKRIRSDAEQLLVPFVAAACPMRN
jgi:hypothetical protein